MNYLAILVCGIVAIIIGSIWHSPKVFGKIWCKINGMEMNFTPEQMKEMNKKMIPTYIAQLVLSIVQIFVLANFIIPKAIAASIIISVWIFIGFIMPTIASAALWSGKPAKIAWQMFGITAGCSLLIMVVVAIILSVWL